LAAICSFGLENANLVFLFLIVTRRPTLLVYLVKVLIALVGVIKAIGSSKMKIDVWVILVMRAHLFPTVHLTKV